MVDFTQVNGHLFLVKKQVGIKLRLKGPLAAGTSQQTAAAGAPVSLTGLTLRHCHAPLLSSEVKQQITDSLCQYSLSSLILSPFACLLN
jgi:hypothetical protein